VLGVFEIGSDELFAWVDLEQLSSCVSHWCLSVRIAIISNTTNNDNFFPARMRGKRNPLTLLVGM
jgi:hypothetical protein